MTSVAVNGLQYQGLNSDENDNSSHAKEHLYVNGTSTDTSDLLKTDTLVLPLKIAETQEESFGYATESGGACQMSLHKIDPSANAYPEKGLPL
ncbi:hypothetical protein CEXT_581001 [Caerostris extrusa]|uniref:Uncharacterized protein n=1 Tax=Caerostris extrusa TaxID=172846 RepID=A0AAV4X0D6_CAEEX|nr:hypothetical protein CEXT_581001 [Caerostris extrusa]